SVWGGRTRSARAQSRAPTATRRPSGLRATALDVAGSSETSSILAPVTGNRLSEQPKSRRAMAATIAPIIEPHTTLRDDQAIRVIVRCVAGGGGRLSAGRRQGGART